LVCHAFRYIRISIPASHPRGTRFAPQNLSEVPGTRDCCWQHTRAHLVPAPPGSLAACRHPGVDCWATAGSPFPRPFSRAMRAAIQRGGTPPPSAPDPASTTIMGRMGGRIAVGTNGVVTELVASNGTAIFAHSKVPYTQHARRCLQGQKCPATARKIPATVARNLSARILHLLHQFQRAVAQGNPTWFGLTLKKVAPCSRASACRYRQSAPGLA